MAGRQLCSLLTEATLLLLNAAHIDIKIDQRSRSTPTSSLENKPSNKTLKVVKGVFIKKSKLVLGENNSLAHF